MYTDTDSVKYLGDIDIKDINNRYQKQSLKNGAYADDRKGDRHFMGVYEQESPDGGYDSFITLGAKKYAYVENGKLHITIAGVNKKKGADELQNIENFKEGFTFYKAGGTESRYNDNVDFSIQIDDHKLRVTDNVVIKDSTYTLGITAEYERLLDLCADIKWSHYNIDGYFTKED